ncbi:hypothetical protein J6R97_00230 [bacterium]|nr:hypothetical protein [bacterium]
MRDLLKKLIVGIFLFLAPSAMAKDYSLLVIPDNIVTDNVAIDSFIYNASAEFFADDIINLLNCTDNIYSPNVSELRNTFKQDAYAMISAKNLTNKFKTTYNIDYTLSKKLADKTNTRYIMLITSFIDAENYILRRTFWDVLNIPGASVVDPAYKISTYAVLIDTEKNMKLWSDTYYKTISVCENRIITRGASPQVEQLQKIKDYSRYLSPQIAKNIQQSILPPEILATESIKIDYNIGNIDNVFTKKYRHLLKEYDKVYQAKKSDVKDFSNDTKMKIVETTDKIKEANTERKAIKEQKKLQSKLEVKATPVIENSEIELNNISNKLKSDNKNLIQAIFKKENNEIKYPELIEIEINKKKKSNLFGEQNLYQPELRDYNQ